MTHRIITMTAFEMAQRFIGIKEVPGSKHNPQIMTMLRLDDVWPDGDEVPWCSAFVNYIAWLLRLPRSKSLMARSWLSVGEGIALGEQEVGFDVVILKRGHEPQPGPESATAPGHVGFYAGSDEHGLLLLGGNQGDTVSVKHYAWDRVIGIRRLA